MQGSDPSRPPELSKATGTWAPSGAALGGGSDNSPTIRSGSGTAPRRPGATALPAPGERLESFELKEAIGAGGMGAVFLALDVRLDRFVALKVLPPEQAADPEIVQRFYQEGRAAARLDHENIARVFTIGHDKGFHFIAFEYVEGMTIRERVEGAGAVPIDEAIHFVLQIAGALVHASERGVVHRDIKPSNIIVTPQGRAKLVDMGLARRFERGGTADDGLTQSGMTLGTFDYISPEQARDPRDVDVRSDLYSLGCTLYHMLTGRPPFPEGTVLQKLLQHQADDPPDVRALNPTIPPELAAIVTKLMAKDPDRRHQTPDQLARDLLKVAGALGLNSIGAESLSWTSPAPPPAWQRHLFWGLPAVALAMIVFALVWAGKEPAPPDGPIAVEPAPASSPAPKPRPDPAAGRPPAPLLEVKPPAPAPAPALTVKPVPAPSPAPPRVTVKTGDDLAAALASAPSGSTLILTDDGPYDLRPAPPSPGAPARPPRRDLTIQAGPRARPVLRSAGGRPALLDFNGGRVVVEGLEFAPEPTDRDEPVAAVRAEDTELTLRRCSFRRKAATLPGKGARLAAVELRATAGQGQDDEKFGLVSLDACAFGPGQAGVTARGPVQLSIRDCTFGATSPALALRDGVKSGPPAQLWLRHVSILASDGPVFRFEGVAPVVRIEDSVVAPAGDAEATLIVAEVPDRLDWAGKHNLYARVGTYLQPARDPAGGPSTTWDFDAWTDDESGTRESGSMETETYVWAEAAPLSALAARDLARALRLGPVERPTRHPGARRGPAGAISPPPSAPVVALSPIRPGSTPRPVGSSKAPAPRPGEAPDGPSSDAVKPLVGPPPPPADWPIPKAEPEPGLIRTASQFLDTLKHLGTRGGTLRLAAGADIDLPSCELRGTGRWTIEAEPGEPRPRLRFRPAPAEAPSSTGVIPLFWLRAGSLQVQGVDLILGRDNSPNPARRAAFAVAAGTDLALTRSTVTVQGDPDHGTLLAVLPAGSDELLGMAVPAAAVRVDEGLLRCGGDLIDVAPGRRLDLEIGDSALAAGGCVVHGHGSPRGQTPEPLKIVLRQVTGCLSGGLVRLESKPGESELPVAEVTARSTILAATPQGNPLILVEGQDSLDALRDRVRWEGHSVAYHHVEVYRRDQTTQIGAMPLRYDLQAWELALGRHEESATHDEVKFAREPALNRPPWTLTRDDVRLAPNKPGADPEHLPGADPLRLPPAPPDDPT